MATCPIQPDPALNRPFTIENFVVTCLVLLAVLMSTLALKASDTTLELTFLDAKAADCLYVKLPGGARYLVDCAAFPRGRAKRRFFERSLAPFLYYKGTSRLEGVIFTRPLRQAGPSATSLLRKLPPKRVFVPLAAASPGPPAPAELAVQDEHISCVYLQRGIRVYLSPEVWLEVLTPATPRFRGTPDDAANNSCAFLLHYRQFRLLYAADLETEALDELADSGLSLACQVLKAPHGGVSWALSEKFFERAQPELTVLSCSPSAHKGDAAPSFLACTARFSKRLLRTDVSGAITIRTRGDSFEVTTALP